MYVCSVLKIQNVLKKYQVGAHKVPRNHTDIPNGQQPSREVLRKTGACWLLLAIWRSSWHIA